MKKLYFTDQEIISGRNKIDLELKVLMVNHLEYEYLEKDIEAYTDYGVFTFILTNGEFDRLGKFEDDLTAGAVLKAGWESFDTSYLNLIENDIFELREKIGEEYTLLQMDNLVQDTLDSDSSIFEGETEEYLEREEHTYTFLEKEDIVNINVKFSIVEDNEDPFEIRVKIVEIEKL